MLQLKKIRKTYRTGELCQDALKEVSIRFRENEFVSILGPSGSGKTTLLNIVGGLDRYDSGDLVINGVSTKQYRDGDWDYYRNHSIGFVFQSYNLIPHQSVLANVELALTLSGVGKKERRQRAQAVLRKVGLGDHLHKRPNQLSGGQMQRVAIARALVNDPDILLADEPTGALDSETSVQIMELLKEIARDKLVIMVTHNPELADRYSTRIVRLLDGQIVDDTRPLTEEEPERSPQKRRKISMSFGTALALSFNNLRTKKGRTLLTAFAGSIGIIGIALILALSTGMDRYITDVQKDTMSSYPVTITDQTFDVSSLIGIQGEVLGEDSREEAPDTSSAHADFRALESAQAFASSIVENDLTGFKSYLEDQDSPIHQYLGENGVVYGYDVNFSVYAYDPEGEWVNTSEALGEEDSDSMMDRMHSITLGAGSESAAHFSQMTPGQNGEAVSQVVTDNYQLLYGAWPQEAHEVVLVLNSRNAIPATTLRQLGFLTEDQYDQALEAIEAGEDPEALDFSYEELCGHSFYLVAACDRYQRQEDGTFTLLEEGPVHQQELEEAAIPLTISGVVRPVGDSQNTAISTAVGYTALLTEELIQHTDESPVVKAQEADPAVNVLNGLEFQPKDDGEKAQEAREYLGNLGVSEKAGFYQLMLYYAQQEGSAQAASEGQAEAAAGAAGASAAGMASAGQLDETAMAGLLDQWLANDPEEEVLLQVYDQYLDGATYQGNLSDFGKVSLDAPSSISLYADSFEDKEGIAQAIADYNDAAPEAERITYTDYVGMLTSSLTTIIDGISLLLIGFVGISLVVSCIMIGIITHISVLERTKEIGILRALGASKGNISQVFNAETFIIGCCAGLIGIGVSLLALLPINHVIQTVSGIPDLSAQLLPLPCAVLVLLSILITILSGLIPAKNAAKKDPVIALRTE